MSKKYNNSKRENDLQEHKVKNKNNHLYISYIYITLISEVK